MRQADLFNQWGIRASEAGDALSKLTITTGLLETAMEQVEEPLDPAVVQKIRDAAVELQALTLEGRGPPKRPHNCASPGNCSGKRSTS